MVIATEVMSKERLDRYIEEAARIADYQDGFGVPGCDLNSGNWWVAYTRQSTREQAENDYFLEYLIKCAKLAKQEGVVVPGEYIIYDAHSSEDFNRPGMVRLRGELIAGRRIAGLIIPYQGRLTMEPLHQLTFEKECEYYGVRIIYGDAPAGNDWSSETARMVQAQANKLRVTTNRNNAYGGALKRVRLGRVPAGKAPYGYNYRRTAIEEKGGKITVTAAWWDVNEVSPDDSLVWGSPAWVVRQIFVWIGAENRTQYWVARRLNELRKDQPLLFQPLYGIHWLPKMVGDVVRRECYTGKGFFNKNGRVPNLEKPLGDLTLGVRRTLLRPKPDNEERVAFTVPSLTTKELWETANQQMTERGRGRGKQGKTVEALIRGRMMCPVCSKPMAVKRKHSGEIYYHCRAHYCKWLADPCLYRRFIPATWDEEIWQEICSMLSDDVWVEQQLGFELDRNKDLDRLIRHQEAKIARYNSKIDKVEDGFDGGLYGLEQALEKKSKYECAINEAEAEIARLKAEIRGFTKEEVEALRQELSLLRDRNLNEATFNDKVDLVARLGIQVYPSEELKSRRISCRLNIRKNTGQREQVGVAKEVIGRPYRSRTCDTLIKS